MSKKVALVTCYFQPNYGSQLQAYATQRILDSLGVENETICISGLKKEINRAKFYYFLSKITDLKTMKDKLGGLKHLVQLKLNKKTFGENVEIRNKKFSEFATEMFRMSEYYSSKVELSLKCSEYAAVLVGSDQLWLPSNIEADYYTLNFVPTEVPRIAYATSFGVTSLPRRQASKASFFLKRIDYLSTREISGKTMIKELIGRDVPIVCDPTLLFSAEEWMSIQNPEPIIKEKYIFCYFLGNNPKQRMIAYELKRKMGLKIVQLQHLDEYIESDNNFPDYAPYDIGPREYLNLIRNAEFVLADSFHGTVFSILHKKPFFTFRRYKQDNIVSTNSRLQSILSLLDLDDRFISDFGSIDYSIVNNIDYDKVHRRLDHFREFSRNYLIKSLESSGVRISLNG